MTCARALLLAHSTLATSAGMLLMFWPAASDVVLGKTSDTLRAYNVAVGAVLVFMGSLLCTAAGAVNKSVLRGVFAGAATAAAGFAWFLVAPHVGMGDAVRAGSKLSRPFVAAGAAVFGVMALSCLAALPSAAPALPAGGKTHGGADVAPKGGAKAAEKQHSH